MPGRGDALVPHVLCERRHGEVVRLDDQVWLFLSERGREVPTLAIRPLLRRRHVFRIALWSAGVDPTNDGLDLIVAERSVVLEFLNPDGPIDLPRRHLAIDDACLDRARPRTRLGEGDERHRRDRIGPVTRFALFLEDRRDVLGKRGRLRCVGSIRQRWDHERDAQRTHACRYRSRRPKLHSHHVRAPSGFYSGTGRFRAGLQTRLYSDGTAPGRSQDRPWSYWVTVTFT